MWFEKNGRKKLIQTFPEETPAFMEGDEWSDARIAIGRRNEDERRAVIERMVANGWHAVGV